MERIYLEPDMVPASLRGSYSGKSFKAVVCTEMTIPATAGLWDGGSRDTYNVVRLDDGRAVEAVNHNAAPWYRERSDVAVTLRPGIAVVEHSMFCGKDMGLTFYIHPDNAAKLLPKPQDDLSTNEKLVLTATRSFKSSYAGRDRYEMMRDHCRGDWRTNTPSFMSRADWDAAKQSLIARGLLNKAGAITVAGRNVARS